MATTSIGSDRKSGSAFERYSDAAFIRDDKKLYFGDDGDVSFMYDETTDNQLELAGPTNIGHFITNTSTAVAGNALVIPVTHGIVIKTTDVDAEALSLANGIDGQLLLIYLTAIGDPAGVGTLTPATKTGFATIVLAEAGDAVLLLFVNSTIGWIIVNTYGKTGAPETSQPA